MLCSFLLTEKYVLRHAAVFTQRVSAKRLKSNFVRKNRQRRTGTNTLNGLRIYYKDVSEDGDTNLNPELDNTDIDSTTSMVSNSSSLDHEVVKKAIEEMFSTSEPVKTTNGESTSVTKVDVSSSSPIEKPSKMDEEPEENRHKFDTLAQMLTGNKNSTILPAYQFDSQLESPFEFLQKVQHKNRLSVTKILPNFFCELKEVFKLYGNVTEKRNAAMKRGVTLHRKVEMVNHPVALVPLKGDISGTDENYNFSAEIELSRLEGFDTIEHIPTPDELERSEIIDKKEHIFTETDISDFEEILSQLAALLKKENQQRESFNYVAVTWSRNIIRLAELFISGEASEVPIHGIYLPSQKRLISSDNQEAFESQNSITLSGIIDKLSIESKVEGAKEMYFQALRDAITESKRPIYDLQNIIPLIFEVSQEWCDKDEPMVYISVKDLKTRGTKSLPPISTQRTSMAQVFIYRALLGALVSEDTTPSNPALASEFAYKMILENMKNRDIDPDTVIAPSLALYLGLNNRYLLDDYRRLQQGESIGFKPYDDYMKSHTFSPEYTLYPLSKLHSLSTQEGSIEELIKSSFDHRLFEKWDKPLTIRYLVARNAQLFSLMNDFLSPFTSVEYFAVDEVFAQTPYTYRYSVAQNVLQSGSDLWLGNRIPEKPKYKNLCKSCDFRLQCEFNRKQQEADSSIS